MNARFDLAISYASDDGWLARDLFDLLTPNGLRIYCYERMPDESRGFLRERLGEIYAESAANILLWSHAYASAAADSFVAMERRFLLHRHVNKGEAATLVPVRVDDAPIARELELALIHDLRVHGVVGLEHLVIERLRSLRYHPTHVGPVFHPPPTERYRGELKPCRFRIASDYERDPLKRWEKLGDILTVFPNTHGTLHVYLIPSGLCTVYLRHTARFRTQPVLVEAKRRAARKFVEELRGGDLAGFWFLGRSPNAPERDVVALYCAEYDRFLNEHFENCLVGAQADQAKTSTASAG